MNALSIGVVGSAFGVVWLLLALVAAALMIRLYLSTRASAFLWLLAAQLLVPIVIRVVSMGVPWIAASHALPSMTVAMILVFAGGVGSLISVVLLIVALTLLQRQWQAGSTINSFPAGYATVPAAYAAAPSAPVAAPYGSSDQPYGRSDS